MESFETDQIDLWKLAHALWKNILLIALVAVICGSAAFGYTAFFIRPAYSATASMYINSSALSLGSTSLSISAAQLNTSSALIPTYSYILKSRTTLEMIAKEAGVKRSSGALSGMISTRAIPNTSAFEITVTSGDPAEAELIANTVAKILPDRIAEIVDGSAARVVDYAVIPSHRSSPSYMNNTLKGIAVGAALCAACVVLYTLLTDRSRTLVQSSDDLRDLYPDIPVLAVIPDMRLSEKKYAYYSSYYGPAEKTGKDGVKHERTKGA